MRILVGLTSLLCFCVVLLMGSTVRAAPNEAGQSPFAWSKLENLPTSLGVAGPFAGTSNGALLIVGGANFPDGPPWEGKPKVWHDTAFVKPAPDAAWVTIEQALPNPRGYGVSISTPTGLLCIGGSDASRHFSDALVLSWQGGKLERKDMPALPIAIANMSGAAIGNVVYVAGGLEAPTGTVALKRFFSIDLAAPDPKWQELEPWPGAERMLAVAAVQDGSFFLVGGVSLAAGTDGKPVRTYLKDGYRYTPGKGWIQIADLPHPLAGAPSPAPSVGTTHFLVLGGDDGTNVSLKPTDPHPGFSLKQLAYHTLTNTWAQMGELPVGHVTTTIVDWNGKIILPSGEIRPAVRSPEVYVGDVIKRKATFGWINYTALGVYLVAMVGIGLWFTRKNDSTEAFFRGGQKIPWWAAGLSIYATMLSSISFMAIPAKAYATDWAFYMNAIAILLVAPLVIYGYLPFFRQLDVTSAYEYLERRFNLVVRLFGSGSFILFQVGRMAIVLYLPALALATVSSFDIYTCIVLMGALCVIYTMFGGIEAVIWTDVVQAIVLAGGALLALLMVVTKIDGGWGGMFRIANDNHKFFQDVSWSWDTGAATATVVLVGSMFSNLISYTASQDVVQRYMTTKDKKRAERSIWMNAAVSIPSSALFFLVGTALFAFYKTHPARLNPALPTDAIFPLFMVTELPVGLAGIVVAGIFAAAQSTLSSSLNSVATAIVTDFYQRFKPSVTDRESLRLAQGITVVLGIVAVTVACVMASRNVASLWDLFLKILGLTGGSLAGLFALGIFTRRANGPGALVGALLSAVMLYFVQQSKDINFFLFAGIGIISCFVFGYVASFLFPAGAQSLTGLTIYTRRSLPDDLSAPPAPAVSPSVS